MARDDHMRPGGWAARLFRLYELTFMGVAAAAMGAIVVVMGVQVFYRYALNDSLVWAEEVCRYLLIFMTFALIGLAFQRGEMVSIQFFTGLLPHRLRHALMVPIYLAMIAFLVTIGAYGYRFATFNARFSMPAVDFMLSALLDRPVSGALSMYWLYLLIPAGCLLLGLHFAAALIRSVRAALDADGRA